MRPFAYLDTSVLVAAHVREPHTRLAQEWLSEHSGKLLLFSAWGLVECASALSIKLRRGEIDAPQQADTMTDIENFVARMTRLVMPTATSFQQARTWCLNASSGLRAGDALHLALAVESGVCQFATLDLNLAANSVSHGMQQAIHLP